MSWAGPTCGFRPLQVRRTLILQSAWVVISASLLHPHLDVSFRGTVLLTLNVQKQGVGVQAAASSSLLVSSGGIHSTSSEQRSRAQGAKSGQRPVRTPFLWSALSQNEQWLPPQACPGTKQCFGRGLGKLSPWSEPQLETYSVPWGRPPPSQPVSAA